MSADYTPTTAEVQDAASEDGATAIEPEAFTRWLAAHDAEIRADALETFAHEVRERYPDDVFPPIDADDHDHINAVLKTYVHVSRDRVSADVFRRAAAQADTAATEIRAQLPPHPHYELFPDMDVQGSLDALSIRKGKP